MWESLFVISLVAYALIGFFVSQLSWRVWCEGTRTGPVSFVLFPYSHTMNEFGESAIIEVIARHFEPVYARRVYLALILVSWPLKLAWNAVVIALMGMIYAFVKTGQAVLMWRVRRRSRSLPPISVSSGSAEEKKRRVKPSSLEIEPETELARLHDQRKRISRRIRKLELQLTKKYGSGKFRVAKRNEEN
ncbi:MAG TPA: hypothetical protein VN397_02750 [Candidatus Methylomirabilis sp.]|nr:hypothetical protein [Candidatus Methylomirabilis sp.]